MNVLVIGGTNFIGPPLVRRPVGLGHVDLIAFAEAGGDLIHEPGGTVRFQSVVVGADLPARPSGRP